ncbi:MAG: sigma-70 family RNA polymerase sigma factor [Planctomycetes bacterium]|nr:sigma-70 family RNA polymerase sigma factor [Planctomycetota bacterium]
MTEPTDHDEWLRRIRTAEPGAIDGFLEQNYANLLHLVRARAGNILDKESPDDIVQSALREVLRALPGAAIEDGKDGLEAWLVRATLRKIIDRHRYYEQGKRSRAREALSLDEARHEALIEALGPSPSGIAARREDIERVLQALHSLREDQRELLALAYLDGLPRAEIAQRIGKSESATRKMLSRTLARLAHIVTRQDP